MPLPPGWGASNPHVGVRPVVSSPPVRADPVLPLLLRRDAPAGLRRALLLAMMLLTPLLLSLGTPGCSDASAERRACVDSVDALADAWARCGYDRDTKRAELLSAFRSCERVERVRDEAALRQECFPALATLDCTDLVADALPDPCLDQILF